jgi:hypothetical protein
MKISLQTIKAFGPYIIVDGGHVPYRSGPASVEFLIQFGSRETYGQGFPCGWFYVEEKLNELSGTDVLSELFTKALNPHPH